MSFFTVSFFLLIHNRCRQWKFPCSSIQLHVKSPMVIRSKKFQIPKEVQAPKAKLRKSENSYNPVNFERYCFSTIQSIPFDGQVWHCQREACANGVLKHLQGVCTLSYCLVINERVYPGHQKIRSADRASLKFSSSM